MLVASCAYSELSSSRALELSSFRRAVGLTFVRNKVAPLEVPVQPGDLVIMAGGTMVHGSPSVPRGAATRFATYAHFEQVAQCLE